MSTKDIAKRDALQDAVTLINTQYGCGPVQLTGTDEALYERHLPSAQKGVGDGIRAGNYAFLAPNAMTINRLGSQYYGNRRALSHIGTSRCAPYWRCQR